jgi:hypothetical protein
MGAIITSKGPSAAISAALSRRQGRVPRHIDPVSVRADHQPHGLRRAGPVVAEHRLHPMSPHAALSPARRQVTRSYPGAASPHGPAVRRAEKLCPPVGQQQGHGVHVEVVQMPVGGGHAVQRRVRRQHLGGQPLEAVMALHAVREVQIHPQRRPGPAFDHKARLGDEEKARLSLRRCQRLCQIFFISSPVVRHVCTGGAVQYFVGESYRSRSPCRPGCSP